MPKIDELFNQLISKNGSDLHLEQGQKPKVRIHGLLTPLEDSLLDENRIKNLLKEIINESAWNNYEQTGDHDFG